MSSLDQKTTEQISELISAARMRNKVLNEWGLGQRIRRGTGIVVLLDGEPGTGKTQTAEVIAAELNLNVARVDVASLVDKYIGETEKNLSRIFTTVRPDVSMLLFDEADSLFARRSQEGKGANERYSNMNINLLLGLVERYGGITVLTTNLKKAIDPAFERRFTYKIRFSLPEKTRTRAHLALPLARTNPERGGDRLRVARREWSSRAARSKTLSFWLPLKPCILTNS